MAVGSSLRVCNVLFIPYFFDVVIPSVPFDHSYFFASYGVRFAPVLQNALKSGFCSKFKRIISAHMFKPNTPLFSGNTKELSAIHNSYILFPGVFQFHSIVIFLCAMARPAINDKVIHFFTDVSF